MQLSIIEFSKSNNFMVPFVSKGKINFGFKTLSYHKVDFKLNFSYEKKSCLISDNPAVVAC